MQDFYHAMKASSRQKFANIDAVKLAKNEVKELAGTATAIINRHNAVLAKTNAPETNSTA